MPCCGPALFACHVYGNQTCGESIRELRQFAVRQEIQAASQGGQLLGIARSGIQSRLQQQLEVGEHPGTSTSPLAIVFQLQQSIGCELLCRLFLQHLEPTLVRRLIFDAAEESRSRCSSFVSDGVSATGRARPDEAARSPRSLDSLGRLLDLDLGFSAFTLAEVAKSPADGLGCSA